MSIETSRKRVRARAARSPLLRKLAGKSPLHPPPATNKDANASVEAIGDDQLWAIAERYDGAYPLEPISYGTARDYADSTDQMPGVARANFDMKDMQRCWTIKAILGNVPRGSRILEIGAGEPLVAGVLSRLGYRVTVFDPYAGSGNGPREYELFKDAYPDVEIVRDEFPPAAPLSGDFAAVYSISVLEHVPIEQIDGVFEAAKETLAAEGGCSIHAVDHVLAGWGADTHLEKLERIVKASGLSPEALTEAIGRMERDAETYFVSTEAHNRWRGALPYAEYPMRRIGSVHLFSRT